ncbi:MAG TPA: hypothetical protein VHA52_02930, partial [Candidatus Babeliaceae bacterium]|nr:hypothetical protein [Candidatus Babeliaceae bacterium]
MKKLYAVLTLPVSLLTVEVGMASMIDARNSSYSSFVKKMEQELNTLENRISELHKSFLESTIQDQAEALNDESRRVEEPYSIQSDAENVVLTIPVGNLDKEGIAVDVNNGTLSINIMRDSQKREITIGNESVIRYIARSKKQDRNGYYDQMEYFVKELLPSRVDVNNAKA